MPFGSLDTEAFKHKLDHLVSEEALNLRGTPNGEGKIRTY